MVNFDPRMIGRVVNEVAGAVALPPEVAIAVNVDEAVMLGRVSTVVAGQSIEVFVSGGAFESLRKAREFDATRCRAVVGHALLRARDRLDPLFGQPPVDDEIPVALEAAWAVYVEGRLDRYGVVVGRRQRRIYHFRVRHGFNDAVDRVFDRLWSTDGLSWSDIESASLQAASRRYPLPV